MINYVKGLVPEAVVCRSHSLTDSSLISSYYDSFGIRYDLNKYIPPIEGARIIPYKSHTCRATVLPFIFEDDIYLSYSKKMDIDFYLSDKFQAPLIFNFHPVHLFLNTFSLVEYDRTRGYYKNPIELAKFQNHYTYGIRDFFSDLVVEAKKKGFGFKMISEENWV